MAHTKRVALKTLKRLTLCLSALAALSAPALALSTGRLSLPSPVKTVPTITLSGRQFKALSLTESASLLSVNPGGIQSIKGGKGLDGADGLGVLVLSPKTPKLPTLSAAQAFPVAEEKVSAETLRRLFDMGTSKNAVSVPAQAELEAVLAD